MDAKIEQNAIPRACNVEDIYRDFKGRRAGLLKALTDDVFEFYLQCNLAKENLRLYGLPDKQWELNAPGDEKDLEEIPPPVLGIKFARNGMRARDWIANVALHSDSWLLAVAFFYAGKSGFNETDRDRLYNMINDLPTLFEIVAWKALKKVPMKVKYALSPKCSTTNKGGNIVPKDEDDGSVQDKDEEDGLHKDEEDKLDEEEGDEAHSFPDPNNKVKTARH